MPVHIGTAPGAPPRIADLQISDIGATDADRITELWISPLGRTDADQIYRYGNRYLVADRGIAYIFNTRGQIELSFQTGRISALTTNTIAAASGKVYVLDGLNVRVYTASTGAEITAERISVVANILSMTVLGSKLYCLTATEVRVYNLSTRRELTSERLAISSGLAIAGIGSTLYILRRRTTTSRREVEDFRISYGPAMVTEDVTYHNQRDLISRYDTREEAAAAVRARINQYSRVRDRSTFTHRIIETRTLSNTSIELDLFQGHWYGILRYSIRYRTVQNTIIRTSFTRTVTDTTVHRDITPYSLTGTAGTTITASDFLPADIGASGSTLLATDGSNIYRINRTNGVATNAIADIANTVAGDGTYIYAGRDLRVTAYAAAGNARNDANSFSVVAESDVAFSRGVTWNGSHLFVVEEGNRTVKAFTLAGVASTSNDFMLHADNDNPGGISWDGTYFYVIQNDADSDDDRTLNNRVFVYNASGVYQASRSFNTGPGRSVGIAVDAANIYVSKAWTSLSGFPVTAAVYNKAGVSQPSYRFGTVLRGTRWAGMDIEGNRIYITRDPLPPSLPVIAGYNLTTRRVEDTISLPASMRPEGLSVIS